MEGLGRAWLAFAASLFAVASPARSVELLDVVLPQELGRDASGRLLVFAEPAGQDRRPQVINASELRPTTVMVAGQDVRTFGPGRKVEVDLDRDAAPQPFSELPEGEYWVQAVLDPDG